MRIKFFQSSTKTSLDDSSFISTETSGSYHTTASSRSATEPRRGISPYVQQIAEQHNRPKTLTNVMQLFEENEPTRKNPHTITQANPYRVKANGAVVMNRSNIDCDDLLGTPSIFASHISATSSFEATSSTIATNASLQPIANLDHSDARYLSASSGVAGLGTNAMPESGPKIRMESNSSRSTFPLHDSTRFSTDLDSLCSMESWSSSVVMDQPEEDLLYSEQEQHVTALSPPPRDTGKKWYRGRMPSYDVEDACEALTALDANLSHQNHLDFKTKKQHDDHHHDPLSNWKSMFELANQENIRLRQQLQVQQSEHNDRMNQQTDALTTSRREIKYLRSTLSRIQVLSSTNLQKVKRRRQSTGEISFIFHDNGEPSMTLSNRGLHGSSSVALSYERKIKILLDEIDAMQADEEIMHIKRSRLASKNAMLEQQLLARDETIRQLEHDLRVMRLHGNGEY